MVDEQTLFEPRYDVTSAARHLHMPRSTMAAWAKGMGGFKRILDLPAPGYLSFVNLTEAFVLFSMRRHYNIAMPRIREAIEYVEKVMGVEHPLAFQQFVTDKVDLFVHSALGAVNVSRRGQTRLDDVIADLERIEWRGERPIALFPILARREDGERRTIRISPLIAFGQPVIAGTGIPTRTVYERFYGGESVQELADDYDVTTEAIEEAVRAESEPAAA